MFVDKYDKPSSRVQPMTAAARTPQLRRSNLALVLDRLRRRRFVFAVGARRLRRGSPGARSPASSESSRPSDSSSRTRRRATDDRVDRRRSSRSTTGAWWRWRSRSSSTRSVPHSWPSTDRSSPPPGSRGPEPASPRRRRWRMWRRWSVGSTNSSTTRRRRGRDVAWSAAGCRCPDWCGISTAWSSPRRTSAGSMWRSPIRSPRRSVSGFRSSSATMPISVPSPNRVSGRGSAPTT